MLPQRTTRDVRQEISVLRGVLTAPIANKHPGALRLATTISLEVSAVSAPP